MGAKVRNWRELHNGLGIREPYSYWVDTQWLEFRRIYGLRYKRCTPEEADAFDAWLKTKFIV